MPDSSSKKDSSSKVKSRSNSLSSKEHNKDKDKDKETTSSSKKEDRKEDKEKEKDRKEDKKDKDKDKTSYSSPYSYSKSAPAAPAITTASAAMASSSAAPSSGPTTGVGGAPTPTASAISYNSSSGGGGSSRSASKRLLKELSSWEKESSRASASGSSGIEGIERLGPVNEYELLEWEAVINGKGIGGGYDGGRWLLQISIPPNYPLSPPTISFRTPIVHANVALQSGEICLDLLKEAWTPAYSILECVKAVRLLLSHPGTDSPLNVDVAALLRAGDRLAAKRLVEFWCQDQSGGRYKGR